MDVNQQLGFVIMVVIASLGVQVTAGSKVLYWFLLLVLLGMVLFNWQTLDRLVKQYTPRRQDYSDVGTFRR